MMCVVEIGYPLCASFETTPQANSKKSVATPYKKDGIWADLARNSYFEYAALGVICGGRSGRLGKSTLICSD